MCSAPVERKDSDCDVDLINKKSRVTWSTRNDILLKESGLQWQRPALCMHTTLEYDAASG